MSKGLEGLPGPDATEPEGRHFRLNQSQESVPPTAGLMCSRSSQWRLWPDVLQKLVGGWGLEGSEQEPGGEVRDQRRPIMEGFLGYRENGDCNSE